MTSEELRQAVEQHRAWLDGVVGACANLGGASLVSANLSGANLRSADLRDADLVSANLVSADLRGADLSGADLSDADLRSADLRSADLSGVNLRRADLSGANLAGTCLDPAVPVPALTDAELDAAGLELDGPWVLGWRTARSMHVGSTVYAPGSSHVAPWFSVDVEMPCHPGIYLASRDWIDREFGGSAVVRCRALRAELVHAGDKWRAKRLWIAREDGSWPEVAP